MIRLIVGLFLGIIISRNSEAMPAPVALSCVIFGALGMFIFYRYGMHDKNVAVATAVSLAVAKANAQSEANAKAAANAAVNLVLMQQPSTATLPVGSEDYRERIVHESLKVIDSATDSSRVSDTDEQGTYDHDHAVSSNRNRPR